MTEKSPAAFCRPNDIVVYPAHGVGRVISIEEETLYGVTREYYVIAFERLKLTVRVPLNGSGAKTLRPVTNKAIIEAVVQALNSKRRVDRRVWSTRAKDYSVKLSSGNLVRVAEVVRDLHKRPDDAASLSYSEQILYREALDRLLEEAAHVLGLTEAEASAYLTKACEARGRIFTLDYIPPLIPHVKTCRPPKNRASAYRRPYVRNLKRD